MFYQQRAGATVSASHFAGMLWPLRGIAHRALSRLADELLR